MDTYDQTGGAAGGGDTSTGADETATRPQSDSGYTCYLPADFPGADALKEGDEITLKVLGKDKDGDLEVQHVAAGEEEGGGDKLDMMDDLDQTMAEKG